MSNDERITTARHVSSSFVIRISFVIRHSCFLILDAVQEQEQEHGHEQKS